MLSLRVITFIFKKFTSVVRTFVGKFDSFIHYQLSWVSRYLLCHLSYLVPPLFCQKVYQNMSDSVHLLQKSLQIVSHLLDCDMEGLNGCPLLEHAFGSCLKSFQGHQSLCSHFLWYLQLFFPSELWLHLLKQIGVIKVGKDIYA